MKPINDPLTRATMKTAALLASNHECRIIDRECLSRSLEALAVSRELLTVPVYKPLSGLWRVAGRRGRCESR